ncbi:MAG: lptD [Nevskia sp.]|nr:lptD [Nevskia sp.]
MRFLLRSPLRLAVALAGLYCGGAVLGDGYEAPKDPASCPQLQYTNELPPVIADPNLVLDANHFEAIEGGLSRLTGAVHLSQDGRAFAADSVDYDGPHKHISINSESLFRDPRLVIKSEHAEFDMDARTGEFFDTHFTLIPVDGRGTADRIFITGSNTAELDHATYTSCALGNEAWLMSARKLKLDGDSGMGDAHDAVLRFQHVPILYLPYLQYPIDNQRHTGMLAPVFGESSQRGIDIKVPIYLNLAPNYDATLTPRYMSERGAQIGADARYLFAHQEGSFHGEYMPHDDKRGGERDYVEFSHEGRLSERLGVEAHYGDVSDLDYFSDLGARFDLSSTPYLARGATLTYQAPTAYSIVALVQDYQPVTTQLNGIDEPYTRLPQIRLDALTPGSWYGTRAGFNGEFTNFVRDANSVDGLRLIGQPYLRWDTDHNAWFASAQGDLNYTAYSLTHVPDGTPSQPRRTLPIFSADGGLRFERETASGTLQILEPHIQYLVVPYRNQDQLPLFDSGQPDFDFPQLFALNRYSGSDRIADANQLTSALTTRFIDPQTGLVRVTASFGEVYYFRPPRVELPGVDLPSSGASDYIAELTYQINRRWSTDAALEVAPQFDRISRSAIALRYRQPDMGLQGQRIDIAYRYRQGLLEQTDVSFSTPIVNSWRIASQFKYSLRENKSLDSFVGLEYETCCWALRSTYRRYLSSSNGTFSNGVYFQLELKGLTRLGNGFDALLPALDPDASIVGPRASKVLP